MGTSSQAKHVNSMREADGAAPMNLDPSEISTGKEMVEAPGQASHQVHELDGNVGDNVDHRKRTKKSKG